MTEMDEHFEELISAYFDGEATAEQRQQVEKLLTEDSDAHALLEELNALRADVKSLPTYQLESDFADRVIGRIQQAVRDNGTPPAEDGLAVAPSRAGTSNQPADNHPADFATSAHEPGTRESGMGRGLLWSALAVAAAVLIMVVTNDADRQLVQQDAPAEGETQQEEPASKVADESGAADRIAAAKTAEANQPAAKMTGPAGQEPLTASEVYAPDAKRATAEADKGRGYGSVVAGSGPRATPGEKSRRADELGFAAGNQPLDPGAGGGTLQDAPAPEAPLRDAVATGNVPAAAHGVAFFQVARNTDPADIEAVFRKELKAEKLLSDNLALRRNNEDKELAQMREQLKSIPQEESSAGGAARQQQDATVYLQLEGTSEQIAQVLKKFATGRRSVRLVRTDQRLGDMLALASKMDTTRGGRTGFDMKKDAVDTVEAVDQLAQDDQLADNDAAPALGKGKQRGLAQPATTPLDDFDGSAAAKGGRYSEGKKPTLKNDARPAPDFPAPNFVEGQNANNQAPERAPEDLRREEKSTDEADDGEPDKSNRKFGREDDSDASKCEYEGRNSRQLEEVEGKLARTRRVAPGKAQPQTNRPPTAASGDAQEAKPSSTLDDAEGLPANEQAAPGTPPLVAARKDGQAAQEGDRVYRILLVVELGRTFDAPTASIRAKTADEAPAASIQSIDSSEAEIDAKAH